MSDAWIRSLVTDDLDPITEAIGLARKAGEWTPDDAEGRSLRFELAGTLAESAEQIANDLAAYRTAGTLLEYSTETARAVLSQLVALVIDLTEPEGPLPDPDDDGGVLGDGTDYRNLGADIREAADRLEKVLRP